MIALKQNTRHSRQRELTPAQQCEMYGAIVKRETTHLAEHYIKLCVETNNTFPNYRRACYTAAKAEVEARYE